VRHRRTRSVSMAPGASSGTGARSSFRIGKRRRSSEIGATGEGATAHATPPAQTVGRAEVEQAPRKAPRAAKTDEQREQLDADGSPRMDAAARGAAAAKSIEAAGIVMMHGAVAQHTFTAHRRAHDAGVGAVVKRARPDSCVEQGQHQPQHGPVPRPTTNPPPAPSV
jgi:hypothetical protein